MKKPITPSEWNRLSGKEKSERCGKFNREMNAYVELGCPTDKTLLIEKAIKHQTPIPTGYDENNKAIYGGFE